MSKLMQNERIFDALFQTAVYQSAEEELATLKVAPEDWHTFSEAHERRLKVILRRHHRRESWKHTLPDARRVAVLVLLIISITFGGLMTVEAVRNEVVRVVIQWFVKFTDVGFLSEGTEAAGEDIDLRESGAMLPSYVPEGFELIDSSQSRIRVMHLYQNSLNDTIVYDQILRAEGEAASLDNENHDIVKTVISGHDGIIATSNQPELKSVILIWNDGIFTYSIMGEIDENQAIAMAESLINKNQK